MKKIIVLFILSFTVFASKDTWQEGSGKWERIGIPQVVFSGGTYKDDFKFKTDFRCLILGYDMQQAFWKKKGLALGLGSYYMTDIGFATYLEMAYGTFGFNQFNGRARIGVNTDGDMVTGISLTKSITFLVMDTSLDVINKDGDNDAIVTVGLGIGF